MFGKTKIMLGAALAAALLASGASAAVAQSSGVQVTADPATIAVGDTTTVTATGLGGLETAGFGLDNTSDGSLSADGSSFSSTASVPASNGSAVVYFKASAAGTYTVNVSDGETSLGQATVTVTDAAPPSEQAQLAASPSSVTAGQSATITATGLGGLESAAFGLGSGPAGASVNPESATVSGGTASTTFTATEPGTYTVDVTDGETPLATVEVTVTAASTPTPTVAPTPAPAPTEDGVAPWVVWLIVIIALLVIAAIVITVVVRNRRRARRTTT